MKIQLFAVTLAGLALISTDVAAEQTLRFSTTTAGAIAVTGNTLGLAGGGGVNAPSTHGSIATFISLDLLSRDGDFPDGTTDDWTANGSQAFLDIPEDAVVLHAEVIWGGSWAGGTEDVSSDLESAVTFGTPDGDHAVSPDPATASDLDLTAASGFGVRYYTRSNSVTDEVRAGGRGFYSVGGVPGTQDALVNELNAAGWILAVAYHDSDEPGRNLSIFSGADWVDEDATLDTVASGFCAPPSGSVDGLIHVAAIEGDAHFSGDSLQVGDGDGFEILSGPYNPEDNFFGSQINDSAGERDTRGTFGDRNQDAIGGTNSVGGRQGWDITAVGISSAEGHLNNGQTEATIRATTSGDSFVVSMVAFEIDVNAPTFDTTDAVELSAGPVEVGDTLEVETLIENLGSADADLIEFILELPDGVSLLGGAIDVDGASVAADASSLLGGVELGALAVDESFLVTVELSIDSVVPGTPIEIRPIWSYGWQTCPTSPPVSALAYATPVLAETGALLVEGTADPVTGDVLAPYDPITYLFTVENLGSMESESITLIPTVSEGLRYVPGSTFIDGTAIDSETFPLAPQYAAGSLDARASMQIEATFEVAPDARAEVQLSAELAGREFSLSHGVNDDVDEDGWSNTREDVNGDGELDDDDTDDNGVPNFEDPDDDGDTVLTREDNCPLTPNTDQADSDGDGIGDACAGDRDGDTIPDEDDNCPDTPNPDQLDTDGDGDGNACDPDDDGDSVADTDDNCPLTANPDQADLDGDGEGDACDSDIDGDRLDNDDEDGRGTNPEDADTDGGGVEDGDEVDRGSDPLDPSDDFPLAEDVGVDTGVDAGADTGADGRSGQATSVAGCCATSNEPQRALPGFLALVGLIALRRRR